MAAIEVTIEKLIYGGDGLARLNGQVVLTPFVLPGEKTLVEPRERKPGLLRAKLIQVREPVSARVTPPCPYFGRCGGCHYQHASYQTQLELKRAILAETLQRVGKFAPPEEIAIVAGEPWGYRNRSQLHIGEGKIGYLEAGSHKLCPIDHCPISSPRINETIRTLLEMIRDSRWPRFVRSIELFTNEEDVQLNVLETERPVAQRFFDWCAEEIPGLVAGALEYPAGGITYRIGHGSFFQVNRFLLDRMVEIALADAQLAGAQDHARGLYGRSETCPTGVHGRPETCPTGVALDLYAGVGLFSLRLAQRVGRVTAVEAGSSAMRDLRFNAERAGLKIAVHQSRVADFLQTFSERPDFVLADPPRAGLGQDVVRRLAEIHPHRITIVSCDPATLARDLAALLAAAYRIERITLIDLFPQTFHIETIVELAE